MSPKNLESSQSSIESCTLHLLSWRPFQTAISKTLDSSSEPPHKPYDSHSTPIKRPCLSDRSTAISIEAFSRLSLADDDNGVKSSYKRRGFRPVERKRRRRGSRSVSGRSSDRSGTLRCCSVNAQVTTCSEFQFAVGTDSSGELFCEANWSSDVSEAARNSRRDRDLSVGEKEGGGFGLGFGIGVVDPMGNESGYGSEPGYRGDAEIGYGDEFDEEEEDSKLLFWGDTESSKEICADERKFSDNKSHYRCRRGRRNDYKAIDSMTHDISLLHLQPHRFNQSNVISSGD